MNVATHQLDEQGYHFVTVPASNQEQLEIDLNQYGAQGYQVQGSITTADGVRLVIMCGPISTLDSTLESALGSFKNRKNFGLFVDAVEQIKNDPAILTTGKISATLISVGLKDNQHDRYLLDDMLKAVGLKEE